MIEGVDLVLCLEQSIQTRMGVVGRREKAHTIKKASTTETWIFYRF